MKHAIALVLQLSAASAALAQTPLPPDPSTLALPDLTPSGDPDAIENGRKYFYFHKAGVTYEEAYADFLDCYRFLPAAGISIENAALPLFTSWGEPVGALTGEEVKNASDAGLFARSRERRTTQSRMRRCMEPRGYVRYGIPEISWEHLIDNYSEQSIAFQAKAASGPKPNREPEAK